MWLLDYDGIVNAVTRKPDPSIWPDWTFVEVFSRSTGFAWPVWYSPTVVQFIADAHAAGVEIRWLSTWLGDTAEFPAAMPGMPRLPWLAKPAPLIRGVDDDPRETEFDPWWKYRVARVEAKDRPLIWTDDDLASWAPDTREALTWAQKRPHTLVEAPAQTTGLTPRRLRRIAAFLADHGTVLPDRS